MAGDATITTIDSLEMIAFGLEPALQGAKLGVVV
jgi:hypothetical protein